MNAEVKTSTAKRVQKGDREKLVEFAPYTLILKQAEKQIEFDQFIREKTRSYSRVLIPILGVVTVVVFVTSTQLEDQEKEVAQQFSILLGSQVLASAPLLLLSFRQLWLIELLQPVSLVIQFLSILLINLSDFFDERYGEEHRQQQIYFCICIYLLHALFTSARFFKGIVFRTLTMLTLIIGLGFYRAEMGDGNNLVQGIAYIVLFSVIFEISTFNNYDLVIFDQEQGVEEKAFKEPIIAFRERLTSHLGKSRCPKFCLLQSPSPRSFELYLESSSQSQNEPKIDFYLKKPVSEDDLIRMFSTTSTDSDQD